MTSDQVITIIGSFLSGGIGGLAAVFAYAHGYLNLEKIERRKQKVTLAYELMASRYVLSDANGARPSSEARDFHRAINLIPLVFAEHDTVKRLFDKFLTDKSNENLFALIEEVFRASGLKDKYAISRTHLSKTFTIPTKG
jgi:hypothetical protein